eukprot:355638-Chlamydomonas_euryale.AAC.4
MTRSALAAKTASGGSISVAAASLGNAALANAPKQGGGYFGNGTPRCRRPYLARLANAARALQWNHPLSHYLQQPATFHDQATLLPPPLCAGPPRPPATFEGWVLVAALGL